MEKNSGGVTFPALLGLLFVGLKLGGVIHWSWWWVLAPFWGPLAAVATLLIFSFLAGAYLAKRG